MSSVRLRRSLKSCYCCIDRIFVLRLFLSQDLGRIHIHVHIKISNIFIIFSNEWKPSETLVHSCNPPPLQYIFLIRNIWNYGFKGTFFYLKSDGEAKANGKIYLLISPLTSFWGHPNIWLIKMLHKWKAFSGGGHDHILHDQSMVCY